MMSSVRRAVLGLVPIVLLAGVLSSVPALAGERRDEPRAVSATHPDAPKLRLRANPGASGPVGRSARRLGREVSRLAAAARPRPEAVHPVVGPADYGEAGAQFGAARSGHVHAGQDVFAPAGTPLVAVRDGVVVETGSDGGRGNYVALFSPDASETYLYLHMQSPTPLAIGARVRAGGEVGSVGCTGSCFGDHLHFEIRSGRGTTGEARDPLPDLQDWKPAA